MQNTNLIAKINASDPRAKWVLSQSIILTQLNDDDKEYRIPNSTVTLYDVSENLFHTACKLMGLTEIETDMLFEDLEIIKVIFENKTPMFNL